MSKSDIINPLMLNPSNYLLYQKN